ncbi:MAG TPA: class I SAM-dependent methyltransferase [Syntrophales bacterium]|nr:class I SAM-dependent methyltransferase [Syntrophales bacterium]
MVSWLRRTIRRMGQAGPDDSGREAGRYWRMSADDDRIRDQSHWCGSGRWARERWMEHGEFHRDLLEERFRRFAAAGTAFPPGDAQALEWGCGGGALTRILCERFSRIYGVEISGATLQECRCQMERLGHRNFRDTLIAAEHPESILDIVPAGSVDFILSIAVFQHFPSRAYTGRVIRVMEKLLRDGAFAFLQMRYSDGSDRYRTKEGEGSYAAHVITMTSFPFRDFRNLLEDTGLDVLEAARDLDDRQENHGYFFIRKRGGLSG